LEHGDLQRARIARATGARQSKKLMRGIKEFYSEMSARRFDFKFQSKA
jgi:hypothetical protein